MGKVIAFSESYRERPLPASSSKGEAAVINIDEARSEANRREHFQNQFQQYLQLETECNRLMQQRRRGFPFSVEPSRQAVRAFITETAAVIEFLQDAGADAHTFKCLGAVENQARALCGSIDSLQYMSQKYTKEMGDVFFRLEEHLSDLRDYLRPLSDSQGIKLPEPALRF